MCKHCEGKLTKEEQEEMISDFKELASTLEKFLSIDDIDEKFELVMKDLIKSFVKHNVNNVEAMLIIKRIDDEYLSAYTKVMNGEEND